MTSRQENSGSARHVQAFYTVNHDQIISFIDQWTLFQATYKSGKYTIFNPKLRKVQQGAPQGGLMSPILLNLFLCIIPESPTGSPLFSYADEYPVLAKEKSIPQPQYAKNSTSNLQVLSIIQQAIKQKKIQGKTVTHL